MATKIKLTRPELKRFRDSLARFKRFLPMLKLKQQQLQMAIRTVNQEHRVAQAAIKAAREVFEPYSSILADVAGINVKELAEPKEIKTSSVNIAGLNIPVFESIVFESVKYSLFSTAPWVDRAVGDLCEIKECQVRADVLEQQRQLLQVELTKISQRVNLFEKVKIPEAQEVIRVIRIKLGDEMTAAVGRAKIAKGKITETTEVETSHAHSDEHKVA